MQSILFETVETKQTFEALPLFVLLHVLIARILWDVELNTDFYKHLEICGNSLGLQVKVVENVINLSGS